MINRIKLEVIFVLLLFLFLFYPIRRSYTQISQKNNRLQIAIGKDENVFEEITNKTDDYFLRCLIKQNWLYSGLKETERLNLFVWSTFYQNQNQENKYIIDFSNYYSHT